MTDVDVFLSHHGVKGMKWGVRKDLDSSEIKFNKGDKLFTITNSKEDQKNRSVYTSFTPRDRDNYKGDLASSRALNGPVFEKTFTLDRPLKIASEKKSFEAFQKIYQKDPERLLRDLAESKHERDLIAAAARKITKVDRSDKYYKSLSKKGQNWVEKKGFDLFITNLGTEHSATHVSRRSYFTELARQGYGGILDRNDIKNYGSQKPLLIFNGSKSLGKSEVQELTPKDMDLAMKRYYANKYKH